MLASGHLSNYLLLLLKGLAITLELSLGSLVLGSLGGILLGAMRSSVWRALKAIALVYPFLRSNAEWNERIAVLEDAMHLKTDEMEELAIEAAAAAGSIKATVK